jgi:hypothetical protein
MTNTLVFAPVALDGREGRPQARPESYAQAGPGRGLVASF